MKVDAIIIEFFLEVGLVMAALRRRNKLLAGRREYVFVYSPTFLAKFEVNLKISDVESMRDCCCVLG